MPPPFLPGEGGCNPITKSGALILISVVPAKAGTQGFQLLAPGSPLSRGRRVGLSAGFPDSLEGRDPCRKWAPAFAGVTGFLMSALARRRLMNLANGSEHYQGERRLLHRITIESQKLGCFGARQSLPSAIPWAR